MQFLIKIFTISAFVFIAVPNIKAQNDILNLEKDDDEFNNMIIVALFDKLNWLVREVKTANQQFMDFDKRLKRQENLRNLNLLAFKAEIKELLHQQDLKTEKFLWDMRKEILKNFDQQESSLKNISINIENLDIASLKQNRNWLTVLRRQDGSQKFNRTWNEYKVGFGDVNGDFFIGLEKLHAITTHGNSQELLVILRDSDNQTRYAKYSDFQIGSENEKYKIKNIGEYRGDAGDSLSQYLNCPFSTYDQNNDNTTVSTCSKAHNGGWWSSDCYKSHLTPPYTPLSKVATLRQSGMPWYSWQGFNHSVVYAEMLIRPKELYLRW